jgi:hypothetical protein
MRRYFGYYMRQMQAPEQESSGPDLQNDLPTRLGYICVRYQSVKRELTDNFNRHRRKAHNIAANQTYNICSFQFQKLGVCNIFLDSLTRNVGISVIFYDRNLHTQSVNSKFPS